jgi:RNA-binding protein
MPQSEPTLRELKSRAQLLKPTLKLGKAGASPEFLTEFKNLLERHKLVKIRFEGFKDERKSLSKELAEMTRSTLVQQVGHTAVFYGLPAKLENQEPQ